MPPRSGKKSKRKVSTANRKKKSAESAPSPQRTFFGINELVAEVIGYLSSSREEIIKCLYVSKMFYTAAVPLVYKYVPFRYCHNDEEINSCLRRKYLRAVIAHEPTACVKWEIYPPVPVLFEDAFLYWKGEESDWSEGWIGVTGREAQDAIHIGSFKPPPIHILLSLWYNDTPQLKSSEVASFSPPPPEVTEGKTLTFIPVPLYISGYRPSIGGKFCTSRLSFAATLYSDREIILVGLELIDPFTKDWKAADCKAEFLKSLDDDIKLRYGVKKGSKLFEEYKTRLLSRIRFVTFKDYLEAKGEWKDFLNWRKVGEWLNKHDEREVEEMERRRAQTMMEANERQRLEETANQTSVSEPTTEATSAIPGKLDAERAGGTDYSQGSTDSYAMDHVPWAGDPDSLHSNWNFW